MQSEPGVNSGVSCEFGVPGLGFEIDPRNQPARNRTSRRDFGEMSVCVEHRARTGLGTFVQSGKLARLPGTRPVERDAYSARLIEQHELFIQLSDLQ